MRVTLKGGAYQAQSIIADAQRCINLYPEQNPDQANSEFTHYQTPGLTLVSSPPVAGVCRCIYTATNGQRFDVIGQNVYAVNAGNTYTNIGTLATVSGMVSISDNGTNAILVDGSTVGWKISLTTNAMIQLVDPAFYGADKVDYVDGFFIFNKPNSAQWYISNYQDVTFNPLDIASKSTDADSLVTLIVIHRDIWLLGALNTEVWYNTGAADFTFGRLPGIYIEHGCAAKYSVAKIDTSVFWLSKDRQGQGIVVRGANYQAERISTHAIETAIASYSTISDAIGYTYQYGGHAFYMLSFPTADVTWCFDLATQQWHQRAFLNPDGSLSRHLSNCHSANGGRNLVGDWQNGSVYQFDPNSYTDNGKPILRLRSFPYIGNDSKRVFYHQFVADMEVGRGLADFTDPMVRLRWSDDQGASWGNAVSQSLGKQGQYLTSVQFQRLGYARDRVFELSWSAAVKTALNGAFIDMKVART
ncbi:MAG: hypothetical protein KGI50_05955 [Patescibacteria group bacterium]|nr:hypothetical protein [Patescibacteria group bacterium]